MSSPSPSFSSIYKPASTSKDYAHLTAQILAHYDSSSLVLSHRTDISDVLAKTLDMPDDRLEYFALVLAIKTDEFDRAVNVQVNRDDFQIKTDVGEGTKCRMGLKLVTQDNEYAIVMGPQGDDREEAIKGFVEEVERAGEGILAGLDGGDDEDGDEDAEGEGEEINDEALELAK